MRRAVTPGYPTIPGWSAAPPVPSLGGMTHFSAPGAGPELDSKDARITVKVGAEHTGGAYELFEVDAPRGPSVPPHAEPWAKSFYVLHGRITVYVDGELHDLGPGASISIPAGAVNTFTVHTPSAQFLAVALTAGMGRFFRDVDQASPDRIPEIASRHGVELAQP
jgi:quercetin dioxygenase-like cupin family protein